MYSVVIAAGGSGLRTGLSERKIWYPIHDQPVIEHTVRAFEADLDCEQIVIAAHQDDVERLHTHFKHRVTVVEGGLTRSDSVQAGLNVSSAPIVLIHDAARPCLPLTALERLKKALKHYEAVTLAVEIVDTLKLITEDQQLMTVSREGLMAIQTPQAFQREKLQRAYQRWLDAKKPAYPCDASLYEAMLSEPVHVVVGARTNIKFTTLDDVPLLEAVLS